MNISSEIFQHATSLQKVTLNICPIIFTEYFSICYYYYYYYQLAILCQHPQLFIHQQVSHQDVGQEVG